jgi:hypothetical protein
VVPSDGGEVLYHPCLTSKMYSSFGVPIMETSTISHNREGMRSAKWKCHGELVAWWLVTLSQELQRRLNLEISLELLLRWGSDT